MNSPESAVILLVEDREDDILLIRKAFEKAEFANPIYFVKNGEEAVAYLMGDATFSNRNEYPLPDLILLDLKMPKLDGFETLLWIRNQPGVRNIPVVILTSSEDLGDVTRRTPWERIHFWAIHDRFMPRMRTSERRTLDGGKWWLHLSASWRPRHAPPDSAYEWHNSGGRKCRLP